MTGDAASFAIRLSVDSSTAGPKMENLFRQDGIAYGLLQAEEVTGDAGPRNQRHVQILRD